MKPDSHALRAEDRRVDSARAFEAGGRFSLVAIGNFDGVHRGHRAVLATARKDARARGLSLVVLTFEPHPAEVLGRGHQATLTTLERKIELLCRLDPELRVVVEPFTHELSRTSPRAFAEELLSRSLGAKVVVVGQNFRFGRDRSGDLSLLESLGRELGFEARVEPLAHDAEGPISSSRIRERIAAGDVVRAEEWLGRPHSISGVVIRGDGRGRTISVPTANLGDVPEALPAHGVYSCLVDLLEPSASRRLATGVANLGDRPTVAAGFSVEVHLHDFDGDLYGKKLRVHFVERVRAEHKFESFEALVRQIRTDIKIARVQTASRAPDPAAAGCWY